MSDRDEYGVVWNCRPEDVAKGERYRIIRAPDTGTLAMTILSHRILGVRTHWWNGRTQGCRGEQCPACAKGESSRYHAYFVAITKVNREQVIVEVTEGPAEKLEAFFSQARTLRGLPCHMLRVGGRANGRVLIRFFDQLDIDARKLLPAAPTLEAVLRRVWGWETLEDQKKVQRPKLDEEPPEQHFGIVD